MTASLEPLGNSVVCKLEDKVAQTASGFLLAPSATKKSRIAEVVKVGNLEGVNLEAGDKVIFEEYSGHEIEIDDVTYQIVSLDDIIAKYIEE